MQVEGSGQMQEALCKRSQQGPWVDWIRAMRAREGLTVTHALGLCSQVDHNAIYRDIKSGRRTVPFWTCLE